MITGKQTTGKQNFPRPRLAKQKKTEEPTWSSRSQELKRETKCMSNERTQKLLPTCCMSSSDPFSSESSRWQ